MNCRGRSRKRGLPEGTCEGGDVRAATLGPGNPGSFSIADASQPLPSLHASDLLPSAFPLVHQMRTAIFSNPDLRMSSLGTVPTLWGHRVSVLLPKTTPSSSALHPRLADAVIYPLLPSPVLLFFFDRTLLTFIFKITALSRYNSCTTQVTYSDVRFNGSQYIQTYATTETINFRTLSSPCNPPRTPPPISNDSPSTSRPPALDNRSYTLCVYRFACSGHFK